MPDQVIEMRWADSPGAVGEWCVIENGLVYPFGSYDSDREACENAIHACRHTSLAQDRYHASKNLTIRFDPNL